MPLRVDSKFFMFAVFLPEVVCRFSDDTTGELLCPLEIFWNTPGLASVVRAREGSESLPTAAASRLLETAARLDDPVDRNRL